VAAVSGAVCVVVAAAVAVIWRRRRAPAGPRVAIQQPAASADTRGNRDRARVKVLAARGAVCLACRVGSPGPSSTSSWRATWGAACTPCHGPTRVLGRVSQSMMARCASQVCQSRCPLPQGRPRRDPRASKTPPGYRLRYPWLLTLPPPTPHDSPTREPTTQSSASHTRGYGWLPPSPPVSSTYLVLSTSANHAHRHRCLHLHNSHPPHTCQPTHTSQSSSGSTARRHATSRGPGRPSPAPTGRPCEEAPTPSRTPGQAQGLGLASAEGPAANKASGSPGSSPRARRRRSKVRVKRGGPHAAPPTIALGSDDPTRTPSTGAGAACAPRAALESPPGPQAASAMPGRVGLEQPE
jgi:hypothetical protein